MNKRLELLERLVASGQTDSFGRYALAMEYRKLGRTEEARAVFAELKDRDPDYLPTYQMAGQLLTELDRPAEARPWLEAGLELARRLGNDKTAGELEQALEELGQ
jgi:tetratricopeptide (TPR) repeat protein